MEQMARRPQEPQGKRILVPSLGLRKCFFGGSGGSSFSRVAKQMEPCLAEKQKGFPGSSPPGQSGWQGLQTAQREVAVEPGKS